MSEYFTVKKILNNNVVIADHPSLKETIVISKGIGFGKKSGDILPDIAPEKLFVLQDSTEQENYKKLVPYLDNETMSAILSGIEHVRAKVSGTVHEHFHVALTDHLLFAIKRHTQDIHIGNPFLNETKVLYGFEFSLASEVVDIINREAGVQLPEDEIGYIALHIHSAVTNKEINQISKFSKLLSELINIIEREMEMELDKNSIYYERLVRHLRFAIERVVHGEQVEGSKGFINLLKIEYPFCYNLSWKLIKVMQNTLRQKVYDAETIYLTMHLQRLYQYK